MASDKQQMAVQIYMANRGISKAEAMRRAGYSDATARNPKNLTTTKSWQELMDEYLPDDELAAKHHELLNATKFERADFPSFMEQEAIRQVLLDNGCVPRNFETNPKTGVITVWFAVADHRVQAAGLDLAYKLKGRMTTKVEHTGEMPVALVEFLGDDGSTLGQSPVS